MPRFFIDNALNDTTILLQGEDAHHILKVLRMKEGEGITLCDGQGNDYLCKIVSADKNSAKCEVLKKTPSLGEPSIKSTLYMALAKGDKMDFIVQKAVELGVNRIVPFVAERSVSRPDAKSLEKKCDRWRKIAKEAAMQSGRGAIPLVLNVISHEQASKMAGDEHDIALILYENEQNIGIRQVLRNEKWQSIALMVGPEGGFSECEIQRSLECGMKSVSLGTRILRCETAPIAGLSVVMYESGNL